MGWSGMRGLVSLAAALGLPMTREGSVFPYRDLTLFLAFAVVLFTLIVQGMSLAAIVRVLRATEDGDESDKRAARQATAEAALRALAGLDDIPSPIRETVRQDYAARLDHLREADNGAAKVARTPAGETTQLRLRMIEVERLELNRLDLDGAIDHEALVALLGELDIAEIALRRR
jgi:CPA1 family monovalent cation:H+ antiporter